IEPKLFMETGTSRVTEGCVYRVPCTGRDGSIAGQEIPFRGYGPEALGGRKEGGRNWSPKGAAKSVAAAQRPPATASCTVIWQAGMVVWSCLISDASFWKSGRVSPSEYCGLVRMFSQIRTNTA